jgi:hypothetical protein
MVNFTLHEQALSGVSTLYPNALRTYLGLHLRGLKVLLTLKKNLFEEKSTCLVKKIKSGFNYQKKPKNNQKRTFGKSFKIKVLPKSSIFQTQSRTCSKSCCYCCA